jgi:aryl-alcohol dehydrogenase-like predicted oxidoreductase
MNICEKMVLGTAQFGMNYGIANLKGKPTEKDVLSILDLAWERGVRYFDTAPAYGSEKVLGTFIKANGLQNEIKILAKIPSLQSSDYRKSIESNLEISLKYLGCSINVLFFHNPLDSFLLKNNPQFFNNLKRKYPISEFGVSIYDPPEINHLMDSPFQLAFQFPFNVLDRRFEKVNMLPGKRYARSIFLQGVLTSSRGLIENAPEPLVNIQMNYHSLLNKWEIDPIDFAISFVFCSKNVDYFLIGVDTRDQLNEILNIKVEKFDKWKDVDLSSLDYNIEWLNPRKWG